MTKEYPEVGQYIDLGFFTWFRSITGYRIENNAGPDSISQMINMTQSAINGAPLKNDIIGPFIIEDPQTTGYKPVKPLDENATLFLEFAELDYSEENMIEFANRYGLLIQEHRLQLPMSDQSFSGDSLSTWKKEHRDLKNAVQIWEWLRTNDKEKLNLLIKWSEDNETVRYFIGSNSMGILFSVNPPIRPYLLPRCKPGDVIFPTRLLLQKIINDKLGEYPVSPRLLLDDNNELKQYLVPSSLLSAMWYQFYQAVTGKKRYKKCEICNTWEDVTDKRSSWTMHPNCAAKVRMRKLRQK